MTGTKTYKEKETEKTRGKKRYLERKVEESEAEDEIDRYRKPDTGLRRVPIEHDENYKEEHPMFPERTDDKPASN